MSSSNLTHIGSYTLETKLARGGFGNIWQARHPDTDQRVAIKVLHPELVVSEAIVMRFEREARAIAMLRHPNVVELLEFGKLSDNRPYMVMELLPGPNLETYVRDHGAMRPRHVLSVLEQLGNALTVAHEHSIIHRDLKASNVVLCGEADNWRVVLLDFGIAKLLEGGGPDLTASRVTIGSPVCMAPEQIQGKPVSPRTDVYALGSLTFLMLTGQLPFPGSSVDTMHQHLVSPRPRPSDRMDLSPVYDDAVVNAMSQNPADRHASVQAFLDAYRGALELDEASSASIPIPDATPVLSSASTLCVGLYLDVGIDQADIDGADDSLLDDMDAIYPRASRFLERRGFSLAYESGDSALFVLPLPPSENDRRTTRQRIIGHAHELVRDLAIRNGRDPRIRVRLHLHVDEATLARGLVTDGPLLDITKWVEPAAGDGVSTTTAMTRGLDRA